MKLGNIVGFGFALAVASSPAWAFQEQNAGQTPAAVDAPAAATAPAAKDLGLSADTAPRAENGTEVRIPGFGKLGVLPKMDFGLELLYGVGEAKQPAPEPEAPAEDLTIRGTMKHNF